MRVVHNLLLALTLVGGSVAAWVLPDLIHPAAVADAAAPDAGLIRRQSIEFYERRLAEDPHSALDMASLAALFLEEGRMAGDERAFFKAESLARRSLGERIRRNGRSAALLSNAMLAQHRFAEAESVARELVTEALDEPAYHALLAEAAMEYGDYDEAVRQLHAARMKRDDLGISPRFARWAELTGRPGEARRILARARDAARQRSDLGGSQRAWFSLRLADLELRHGNLRSAGTAIADGLEDSPADWRLVLARAKLECLRGDWRHSIASAEEVLATVSTPDALAILAVAHRALGQPDEAVTFEVALEQFAFAKPGTVHRSWATTLLDRGSTDSRLVDVAAADTLVRHDVLTLDLLAWALYRNGRAAEALPLTRRAVATGSLEPDLRYHAALIEFAAGDRVVAERHRSVALERSRALTRAQLRELRAAEPAVRN